MILSKQFRDRCASLFKSQQNRSKGRVSKTGRVTKHGYSLPFDIGNFTAWFLGKLGGNENAIIRCPYCTAPMTAYTCVVDHENPLKRGGSPGLENLGLTCEKCNNIKGQMNAEEFRLFLDKMREIEIRFGPAPVRNITSRLESQTKLAAGARWNRAKAFRQQAQAAVQQAQSAEDF